MLANAMLQHPRLAIPKTVQPKFVRRQGRLLPGSRCEGDLQIPLRKGACRLLSQGAGMKDLLTQIRLATSVVQRICFLLCGLVP